MAIPGILNINIGLQNESIGSDSLYTAFNKTKDNFTNLFQNSSSFTSFYGNTGISVAYGNSNTSVEITNTGVTNIIAGTGITIDKANGDVTISSTGGGGNGVGVTSVGVTSTTLSVSNSPIVSSGNISVNLPTISGVAGTYTYPQLTVDNQGRISNISNGSSVGTVTSVAVDPGAGIQVSGSPITTSGNINIINTGVTRLTAGSGITLSGSNGNVTISTINLGGTVTSVGVSSSQLVVTGSPVIGAGTISVELPANLSITNNITAGRALLLQGSENLVNGAAANLQVTASYFTTTGASTATLAAGTNGLIKTFMMVADGGNMVITVTNAGWKTSGTGTITFDDIGDGCTLQYINSKWYCIGSNGVAFA